MSFKSIIIITLNRRKGILSCHGLLKCLLYSGVKGINSLQGINCLKISWNELQALDNGTMHALLRKRCVRT